MRVENDKAASRSQDTVEEERTYEIQGIVRRKLRLTTSLIRFNSPPFRRYVHKNYSTQCQLQCHMQNIRSMSPLLLDFHPFELKHQNLCLFSLSPTKKKNSSLELGAVCTRCLQDQQGYGTAAKDGGERGAQREKERGLYSEHLKMSEDLSGSRRGAARHFVTRCLAQGSCVEGYSG